MMSKQLKSLIQLLSLSFSQVSIKFKAILKTYWSVKMKFKRTSDCWLNRILNLKDKFNKLSKISVQNLISNKEKFYLDVTLNWTKPSLNSKNQPSKYLKELMNSKGTQQQQLNSWKKTNRQCWTSTPKNGKKFLNKQEMLMWTYLQLVCPIMKRFLVVYWIYLMLWKSLEQQMVGEDDRLFIWINHFVHE